MITITLTYRDRDLSIVTKCLDSLKTQSLSDFKVVLVDYGSQSEYVEALFILVKKYHFIKLIQCPVQGQLWNKSRALNIALKQCDTPYFFVGDLDMIYHPNFVKTLHNLKSEQNVTYFQVGFLSENESKQNKEFSDYNIAFKSTDEATRMTLYNTKILKSINGYDEFYHGWGSEDTDVHIRVLNAGNNVQSYPEKYKNWLSHIKENYPWKEVPENFIFINAWNECAEGNHIEPCQKWGTAYLDATKEILSK